MARIALSVETLTPNGGLEISVAALAVHLRALGHEVLVGREFGSVELDLLWLQQSGELADLMKARKKARHFWVQFHDYRDLCLTGRKAIGDEMRSCRQGLSPACFLQHFTRGCGKGRNPVSLAKNYFEKKQLLNQLHAAERVVVYSDAVAKAAIDNGFRSEQIIKVAPWAMSHDSNQASQAAGQGAMTPQTKIVWAGRLVAEKAPLLFVEAMHMIRKMQPHVTGAMFGDGPLKAEVEGLIKKLGLESVISLKGWRPQAEVALEIASSRVVIFTSLWPEPFGLVGTEALSFGVPVVAIDRGGVAEWCRQEFGGQRVSEASSESLARETLTALEEKNWAEHSRLARLAFTKNFSSAVQRERLRQILTAGNV